MQDRPPPQPATSAENHMSATIELTPNERHALFAPSERHVFESFLTASAIDDADWQLYTNLGFPLPAPPSGNASLAKATKDLIALHPSPRIPVPPVQQNWSQSQVQVQALALASSSATSHRPIAPAPPQRQSQHTTRGRQPSKRTRRSSSPVSPPTHTHHPLPQSKPALLTAQQKKANHIQSEQKRRANIRRGYEALCETIPALQEAIRAEEEMSSGTPTGGSGKKKRMRDEGVEKIDGRAGPRSESVVLQKTIEHIQGLLDQRAALESRLEHARSILGHAHPALHPNASPLPLWEREWDGGQGLMVDVNGEVFRDSDEE